MCLVKRGARSGPASAYLRHLANARASVRACTREGQPGRGGGSGGLAWVSIKIITADGGAFLSGIENRFTIAQLPASRARALLVCTYTRVFAARQRPAHVPRKPVVIDSRGYSGIRGKIRLLGGEGKQYSRAKRFAGHASLVSMLAYPDKNDLAMCNSKD